jgi:hypothetical protein
MSAMLPHENSPFAMDAEPDQTWLNNLPCKIPPLLLP